jgi:hypothetical protein
MSWQAFAWSRGEVEGLGGRTRGERAHFNLIFDFSYFPQGGGRNFPRGNNMKW